MEGVEEAAQLIEVEFADSSRLIGRFAKSDTGTFRFMADGVDGQLVCTVDKVVAYHASANRDPLVFDEPHAFDVERSPNPHITFGAGAHHCLGAHFARHQLATIFRELLHRLPDIEMVGEPDYLRANFINGIKHMTAEFTPTA